MSGTETSTPQPRTSQGSASSEFAPTRWTLVMRARGKTPEARTALGELCAFYYEPVFHFLRREGRTEDLARELTQEFFTRVLSGSGFDGADHERGRFRSYLLGALKHFLADVRDRIQSQKRGGGVIHESLDATIGDDESATLQIPDVETLSPEESFDREWALAVMRRALGVLEREMIAKGKGEHFHSLKSWLGGEEPGSTQAETAKRLGLTESAVKVAIHRLRKRFGEIIREEIAQTLKDPELVEEELAELIDILT